MGNKKNKKETQAENEEECPFCGKSFLRLKTHITRSHPTEHRDAIAKSYEDETVQPEDTVLPQDSPALSIVKAKMLEFSEQLAPMAINHPKENEFSELVSDFSNYLKNAIEILPGPKHPNTKFYEARKREKTFCSNDKNFSQPKNPPKSSKRDRIRRRAKYNFELIQYLYHYSRKKAVRLLLQSSFSSASCKIPLETLHQSYSHRWGSPNDSVLEDYGPNVNLNEQTEIDEKYSCSISAETIEQATKGINNDSASGMDGVPIRIIKKIGKSCYEVIAAIATVMIKWNVVPNSLKCAKTVLILKSEAEKDEVDGWRPISICSIIRRIIERVIDQQMEEYVRINQNQVGFTRSPGTYINSSIVNGCLTRAKQEKLDFCIVFLDVRKAFEETSHAYLMQVLNHTVMPVPLRNIIISLLKGNNAKIQTQEGISNPIEVHRSVFQGSPLSPRLFNMSIDHVLKELTEHEISANYGFQLHADVPKISARGFADDIALLSNSMDSARELTKIAVHNFNKVGYVINYDKSKIINIKNGKLCEEALEVYPGCVINAVKKGERMKYLGVNFNDEIIFDPAKTIKNFTKDLQNLVGSPMLYLHQKIKIINQYLWPTLIYPLQTAPLNKLSKKFLTDLDLLIRSSVKEIIGIPTDTPNAMLYTHKKFRGLQIVKATWEAFVQHYNICMTLIKSQDQFVLHTRNFEEEKRSCLESLQLESTEVEGILVKCPKTKPAQILRKILRDKEYKNWCDLPQKGQGVQLFQECPYGNKIIIEKDGLTTSEWVACPKMSANNYPVRAIPGRNLGIPQCRHCTAERETLSHVLGQCQKSALLRNTRHHEIRLIIAKRLKQAPSFGQRFWKVEEEVGCHDENGSPRRVDILCYDKEKKVGFIIDPTVRFEQGSEQAIEVDREKKAIYEPCVKYFKELYRLDEIEVIGILVGARGTMTTFFEQFRKRFALTPTITKDIVVAAIRGSTLIAHHHLYNTN